MQQFQQLQENVSALEKHIFDLRTLRDNIDSLAKSKISSEILMPLGSGIFVKGELKDSNNIIMNVGSGVCVEKTVDEAKDTIHKQLTEVSAVLEQLQEEMNKTSTRLHQLQSDLSEAKQEDLE